MCIDSNKHLVIHCVNDDKFIDNVINVHETLCPQDFQEEFIHLPYKKIDNSDLKWIKNKDKIRILTPDRFIEYVNTQDVSAIVMHCFTSIPVQYIHRIKSSIKVFWIAWGIDLYNVSACCPPFIKLDNLYHSQTRKILNSNFPMFISSIKEHAKAKVNYCHIRKAVNRIDYFSGIIPEEYEFMAKLSYFKAEKFEYTYFRMNSNPYCEANIADVPEPGLNLLIGNNCSPTNNHIDILEHISKFKLSGRKIYTPLSYSGTPAYKRCVIEYGKDKFGDNFVPLMDFMPYNEYLSIINSCGVVILGCERQQAMGNVYSALWQGCKLFLSKTSLIYQFCINKGLTVFSMQDDFNEETISSKLDGSIIKKNRDILMSFIGITNNTKRILSLYSIIRNK